MEIKKKIYYRIVASCELLIIGLLLISIFLPFAFINWPYGEQFLYLGEQELGIWWRIVGCIFLFISSISLFFFKIEISAYSGIIGFIIIGSLVLLVAGTIPLYATSQENKVLLIGFYLDLFCLLIVLGLNLFFLIITRK